LGFSNREGVVKDVGTTLTHLVSQLRCPGIALLFNSANEMGNVMAILLLGLLVLILFGAGFALHLLWIAAVVIAIVWVATFALGRGERRSIRR
jgi:hypothetical protein